MKTLLPLLSLFLLAGCTQQPKDPPPKFISSSPLYEFHLGRGGAVLWRCNRRTGEASFCYPRVNACWYTVAPAFKPIEAGAERVPTWEDTFPFEEAQRTSATGNPAPAFDPSKPFETVPPEKDENGFEIVPPRKGQTNDIFDTFTLEEAQGTNRDSHER